MQLTFAYRGHSTLTRSAKSAALALAPNLRRDKVSFAGQLLDPLRFREAVSALHDVVVSDLKFQPKDRTAHRQFLEQLRKREAAIRSGVAAKTRQDLRDRQPEPMPAGLEAKFQAARKSYWNCRDRYSDHIRREDWSLWRSLVPCDPVITVAPDVLFFECFSKDESSYGCLSVDRDAFAAEEAVSLGTTNVDYSWALYEHFQELRSYRETRFRVDPEGFEVATTANAEADGDGYREEKIDLPASWLRGFMSIQSAMSLPTRKVPITRDGLYAILAFLMRNKAKKSPRAIRFELVPGQPIAVVLEPWEKRIEMPHAVYTGPQAETVRTWGRDRLMLLYRLLPLADGVDVHLLGSGLPCFWVVRMGDMRLTLGLSGWTANDWTSGGSALDQLAPPAEPSYGLLGEIADAFKASPRLKFEQICATTGAASGFVAAGLNKLALYGQVIHDLADGVYRWRQIMPVAVSAEIAGPDNPETVAARKLVGRAVSVTLDDQDAKGQRKLEGQVERRPVEVTLDADSRMVKGKCNCSHHFSGGLRKGPCRHIQALRNKVLNPAGQPKDLSAWFDRLYRGWN